MAGREDGVVSQRLRVIQERIDAICADLGIDPGSPYAQLSREVIAKLLEEQSRDGSTLE